MQTIRKNLRGKATLLMGKNTMIRKAIKGHLSQKPHLETLLPHIKGNIGFVFTDEDLGHIRDAILSEKVSAPAKAGSIAPCDVTVPAGPTGLDPSQTSFMQALNIATKINKGQVEIINPVHIIRKDHKVGQSEAALLQKLNINPFSYGLIPLQVYDNGFCFQPAILDVKDEDILTKFKNSIQKLTALSLGAHLPILSALPHIIGNAFRNLVSISLATDYTFERAEKFKDILSNPEAYVSAAPAPEAAHAPAPEEKAPSKAPEPEKKEEEEVEDEGGFGDLFG